MTREIDSGALLSLNRILGIAGQGSGSTELDDGNLTQVIDVAPVVRRSRVLGATASGGYWYWVQQHVHAAAGVLSSEIDFYDPAFPQNGYPASVPKDYDVWIGSFSGRRTAGAGTLGTARLGIDPNSTSQCTGIDDSGAEVTNTQAQAIYEWDQLSSGVSGIPPAFQNSLTLAVQDHRAWRVPRGSTVACWTNAVGASATFLFQGWLGLFPEGLGQDIFGNAP